MTTTGRRQPPVTNTQGQTMDHGHQLRVDGYILHFLATDHSFYDTFRFAVRQERTRNPNGDAFGTVLNATRMAMYDDKKLIAGQGNVRLNSSNIFDDLKEIRGLLNGDVRYLINEQTPFTFTDDKGQQSSFRILAGVDAFYEDQKQPRTGLVPRQGHGIQPPFRSVGEWNNIKSSQESEHQAAALQEVYEKCLAPGWRNDTGRFIARHILRDPDPDKTCVDHFIKQIPKGSTSDRTP